MPRQREVEAGRDPQHIALAVVFQEPAQFGTGAVDLFSAGEVQPDPAGERLGDDAHGKLALGAEHQAQRQPHHQRRHRVPDLSGRHPLPGADQRMPGPPAHIRQVHGSDAVGDLAHAPQVLPFHARRHAALLDLAGLIDRPGPQAPPAARAAGGLLQPRHREPPHHTHRREGVPHRPVEQPLRPLRHPVPGLLRDRPPVAAGRSLATAPMYLPACRHGSTRAKHGCSSPSSSPRFRAAKAAPILAAAAAFGLVVVTHA
jgi:hypothetical protein